MPITHKLTLDVRKRAVIGQQRVVVRQGEAGTQQIEAAITKDGEPYASSCTGARLEVLHADGTWARVTAAKSGTGVTVTLPSAAINAPGTCRLAHFVFHTGETTVETTEGFELRILPAVDVSGEQSKPYSDEIEALKAKWAEFEAGARKAEEDRKKAQEKNDAAQKRNDDAIAKAVASASGAADSANAASGAAESAAAKANAAAARADEAAKGASENILVGTKTAGLVHVEDAWPTRLRECKVLGKSVQTVTTGKNLLDVKSVTPGKFVNASDGFLVNSVTFSASEMIPVAAGQDYTYAGAPTGTGAGYAWYDAEGAFVSGGNFSGISATVTLTSPERATSLRLTVDDKKSGSAQLEKGSTATAYEPYTGGKPSPRPDFPQPITSVGKAEVVTAGKNLSPVYKLSDVRWGQPLPLVIDALNRLRGIQVTVSCTCTLTEADDEAKVPKSRTGLIIKGLEKVYFYNQPWGAGSKVGTTKTIKTSITIPADDEITNVWAYGCGSSIESSNQTDGAADMLIQIEIGPNATAHEPHATSSTPIDLQGNELRSLPNGVRDEVVVDRNGNVSLVQRVGRTSTAATDGIAAEVGSTAMSSTGQLADGAEVIYQLQSPQAIPLGKVSVPALSESTSNVWNEGNINTDVSATYVRDVTLAFTALESKLTQAVVATAANL